MSYTLKSLLYAVGMVMVPPAAGAESLSNLTGPTHATPEILSMVTGNDSPTVLWDDGRSGDGPQSDHDLADGAHSPMAQVVASVFDRLNRPVEIHAMSRSEAYAAVVSGDAVATFGWQPSSDRMARFHLSDPIAVVPQILFSDAFVALEPETPTALSGRVACLPVGATLPDELQTLVHQNALRTQPANDLATCARLIFDGHVDFFVSGIREGMDILDDLDMRDEFHAADTPIGHETLHLMFPRDRPDSGIAVRQFNIALAALVDTGGQYRGGLDHLLTDLAIAGIPAD